jgi:hypothetical protein
MKKASPEFNLFLRTVGLIITAFLVLYAFMLAIPGNHYDGSWSSQLVPSAYYFLLFCLFSFWCFGMMKKIDDDFAKGVRQFWLFFTIGPLTIHILLQLDFLNSLGFEALGIFSFELRPYGYGTAGVNHAQWLMLHIMQVVATFYLNARIRVMLNYEGDVNTDISESNF